jgi:hypothetical protein
MNLRSLPIGRFLAAALACSALASCIRGPSFLKQSGTEQPAVVEKFFIVPTKVDGETATGELDAEHPDTQVIQAAPDSAVAGSEALFPAGSIAIDTSVSIGPGSDFVTDGVVSDLELGTGVGSAASAVAVESSAPMDASSPFTIALPLPSGSSLTQTDQFANLVVVYRIVKAGVGGEFTGVMTRDMLKIDGSRVRFSTLHLGTYQAVITLQPVTQPIEKVAPPKVLARKAYFRPGFVTTSFETNEADQEGLRGFFHHVSRGRVGTAATISLDVLAKPAGGE